MRKIVNEQGRLFGLISVIDVFAILVVAVLALAVFMKSSPSGTPAATVNTVPVTYTVYINTVRDTAAALLRPGDNLYTDSGTFIGVITGADVTDAKIPSYLNDGSYVTGSVEGRYDVLLTVSAQCSVSGGRYYVERTYELCTNTEQKLCTKYNEVTGVVIDVMVPDNG